MHHPSAGVRHRRPGTRLGPAKGNGCGGIATAVDQDRRTYHQVMGRLGPGPAREAGLADDAASAACAGNISASGAADGQAPVLMLVLPSASHPGLVT